MPLNFNDVPAALVVLLALLVVNNWLGCFVSATTPFCLFFGQIGRPCAIIFVSLSTHSAHANFAGVTCMYIGLCFVISS